jgi:hypothetical protein
MRHLNHLTLLDPPPPLEPAPPRHRRWSPWLVAAIALVGAAVLLSLSLMASCSASHPSKAGRPGAGIPSASASSRDARLSERPGHSGPADLPSEGHRASREFHPLPAIAFCVSECKGTPLIHGVEDGGHIDVGCRCVDSLGKARVRRGTP